jgi:alkanesulfonate monooxygenase SsuD/methylene tetrahydromethanopterin reductase-like flavin-dependent oxidoreductase (luciferase family)
MKFCRGRKGIRRGTSIPGRQPGDRGDPYPYTKDGQRRWQPFTDWPDPWVLVGALAQVTNRLRFVTTVYIPAMRNPYSAAKAIGTEAVSASVSVSV